MSEVVCMCVLVQYTRPGGGRRRGHGLWCLTESHRHLWHICQSSNLHYQIQTWAYLSSPRAHGMAESNTATTPPS